MDVPAAAPDASYQEKHLPEADPSLRVCLIWLGGELFVIDLQHIGEVFEIGPVTPVPGMPAMFLGVTNVRGVILPLIDIHQAMGVSSDRPTSRYAVVIRHEELQIGVAVDRVPEIRSVQTDDFIPTTGHDREGMHPFVSSHLRIEEHVGGVLEVPPLLASMDTH